MEWKDVPGFEGRYKVSELGHIINSSGKVLKARVDKRGYARVNLFDGEKQHTINLHRLVALAFIPNPDDLPQVNHIDEDKTNNRVSNLEWCTNEQNQAHGTRLQRITETCCCRWAKPVEKLADGEPIARYASIGQAAKLNGLKATRIGRVCSGERRTYAGYGWRYAS